MGKLQPPLAVSIGVVHMDDPANLEWLRDLGISSFPVGKLFSYGAPLGTYVSGPSAPEVAQELMRRAELIARQSRQSAVAGSAGARSWLQSWGSS